MLGAYGSVRYDEFPTICIYQHLKYILMALQGAKSLICLYKCAPRVWFAAEMDKDYAIGVRSRSLGR
jgi:hypothetical protein